MKKLIFLIVIIGAAWYGYQKYPELLHRPPKHEAVVLNESGHPVVRLRVGVGGQVFVKDALEPGGTFTFAFSTDRDTPFEMIWEYADSPSEFRWSGGSVTVGPIRQRHMLTLLDDGGATHQAQMKAN